MSRKLSGTIRRWFQFRLTTFLMFVAVVAVAMGWLRDRQQFQAELMKRDAWIQLLRMGSDPIISTIDLPPWLATPATGGAEPMDADRLLRWVHDGPTSNSESPQYFEPGSDPKAAIPHLYDRLQHPNPHVRSRAACALSEVVPFQGASAALIETTISRLFTAFESEQDEFARKMIAIAVRELEGYSIMRDFATPANVLGGAAPSVTPTQNPEDTGLSKF